MIKLDKCGVYSHFTGFIYNPTYILQTKGLNILQRPSFAHQTCDHYQVVATKKDLDRPGFEPGFHL